jgi:hypothetical protein
VELVYLDVCHYYFHCIQWHALTTKLPVEMRTNGLGVDADPEARNLLRRVNAHQGDAADVYNGASNTITPTGELGERIPSATFTAARRRNASASGEKQRKEQK